jgi:hypothetical protein
LMIRMWLLNQHTLPFLLVHTPFHFSYLSRPITPLLLAHLSS